MKATRKNPLSYAVGAILATLAVVPMTASAASIDVGLGAFATDDGADVLAYPIFSTANGLTTSFSLTNTGSDSLAVKVRFREQQYSMDVWDAIVFLSPEDKWDFTVSASAADPNTPQVSAVGGDTTCTTVLPANFPSSFKTSDFNGGLAGNRGPADGRWTVGHVEVIGMMDLTNALLPTALVPLSLGQMVENRDCAGLRNIFSDPSNLPLIAGAADVQNDLIGRFVVNKNGAGLETGGVPIAISNAFAVPLPFSQAAGAAARCDTPTAVNPGACMSTYAWDQFEEDHPHLGDMPLATYSTIDTLAGALIALQGDWSSNPANFVGTDWFVSFFAKYVYTDLIGFPNRVWSDVLPQLKATPFTVLAGAFAPFNPFNAALTAVPPANLNDPRVCLPVDMEGWDADENYSIGGVSPTPLRQFCNEVTVVGLAQDAATARDSLLQQNSGVYQRQVFAFPALATTRGWASLNLDWPGANSAAVAGGLFLTRSEPSNPAANNASLVPLAHWDRTLPR